MDTQRATVPRRATAEQPTVAHRGQPPRQATAQYPQQPDPASPGPETKAYGREEAVPAAPAPVLGSEVRDVDVSAAAFRNLLVGGGVSGFLTILCAAALTDDGGSVWLWFWQIVFGAIFLWFVASAKGSLSSRGFLLDRHALHARTRGEVFGIPWSEIGAAGIGSLPPIQRKRPVPPERRRAFEFYPADPEFVHRHPELERWRIDEPAPMPGLPGVRYRFHLPPLSRLPRRLEHAVQELAPHKWVGHYRRQFPPQ
ncbi:hypothetical protein DFQ14_103168 [Halopolyspora algeriensis]|uniref:Uncharacterized protein n=1 Tax=Halopolyspora algeriensis TaxID=1500506 RepID=A0A368VT64_9ACTN|nr:hypothetical protein DFQ14_103168 [Halopolyspora algeriensis]TQM53079.1 hypothetical protein FHU43_2456 [Halopolyspora algeriensis]